jgi:hypothetical protein
MMAARALQAPPPLVFAAGDSLAETRMQETSESTQDSEAAAERVKFQAWTRMVLPEQLFYFYEIEARLNADG